MNSQTSSSDAPSHEAESHDGPNNQSDLMNSNSDDVESNLNRHLRENANVGALKKLENGMQKMNDFVDQ